MRPIRLREYQLNHKKGDGNFTILVPKFGNGKIGRWLRKRMKNPDYFVHLDEFGSFVWNLCDGEMQVREIGKSLQGKFGDTVDPVNERLSLFFRQMEKSRLIAFREASEGAIVPTALSS